MSSLPNDLAQHQAPDVVAWEDAVVHDHEGFLSRMEEESLCSEIIHEFIRIVPEQIRCIEASVENGDIEALHRQAHTMKGSSSNVGALRLEWVARLLEETAQAADLQRATALAPSLASEFAALKQQVELG